MGALVSPEKREQSGPSVFISSKVVHKIMIIVGFALALSVTVFVECLLIHLSNGDDDSNSSYLKDLTCEDPGR